MKMTTKEEKLWFGMTEEEWKREREKVRRTQEAHYKEGTKNE